MKTSAWSAHTKKDRRFRPEAVSLEDRVVPAVLGSPIRPGQPVAFIINDLGGYDRDRFPDAVYQYLVQHGVVVHVSNWNDILNDAPTGQVVGSVTTTTP